MTEITVFLKGGKPIGFDAHGHTGLSAAIIGNLVHMHRQTGDGFGNHADRRNGHFGTCPLPGRTGD